MQEISNITATLPLFEGLSFRETEALLRRLRGRVQAYDRGAFLLESGRTVRALGLLLEGRALVLQEDYWGNRNLLAKLVPGQLFAETFACLPQTPLSVSVQAEEACRVVWLEVVRALEAEGPAEPGRERFLCNLLRLMAEKNLHLNEKLTHMGQRSTREKLLSYLSAQARRQGGAEFDIPFNRQQLADYLSVERSAMCAALGRLQKEGLLSYRRNHFRLRSGREGPQMGEGT